MISPRMLFVVQRYSAILLAPLVIVHLVVIVLAVRNGLTGEEILQRTRGSALWFTFYSVFVVAVAVHAPIGVRNILNEWTGISRAAINWVCALLSIVFFLLGIRAVLAVT